MIEIIYLLINFCYNGKCCLGNFDCCVDISFDVWIGLK